MEEKERYRPRFENCIEDNTTQITYCVNHRFVICDLLNQQDKRIKELEQENQQLKQQLHDLPKKIVGEVKKQICEDCFWEECEEQHCEFYFIIEYLNAILKRYGGEDE